MAQGLQALTTAQRSLLHDVSHELRSPLARLQAAIGLARQNPQKLESSLDRIESEAGRVDELVGQLLTLSRLETIFEPFYRGSQGRPGRGFGLGLAIARRAGEARGGRVRATNRPGGGLMFEMSVPLG
jgi:signal transduction histidine kinase